jgi:hypothetical protein
MKAADFSHKVRASKRRPSAGRKSPPEDDVDPVRSGDPDVPAEVATASSTLDGHADRTDAPRNSMEDPLEDWPEGGSSGNDEWLRERGDKEGSSS